MMDLLKALHHRKTTKGLQGLRIHVHVYLGSTPTFHISIDLVNYATFIYNKILHFKLDHFRSAFHLNANCNTKILE